MAPTNTVKTSIYIISDTHQGFSKQTSYSQDGAFRPPFPKADILLHSGDLTMTGTIDEYRGALQMLKDIPAELKLVIAGNHDLTLHRDYYLHRRTTSGLLFAQRLDPMNYDPAIVDVAEDMWTGQQAKEAGVTYLTEGLHTFRLSNGAAFTIYASAWQPEFFNWAFNYPHEEDRWNPPGLVDRQTGNRGFAAVPAPAGRDPHPIPQGAAVDILMTHGPPWKHLDRCYNGHLAGCPHLLRALDRVRPKLAVFGHIHEAWGAERVTWKSSGAQPTSAEAGPVGELTETLGTWEEGQRPRDEAVIERRACYADVSAVSQKPLRHGEETLLINSSIMSLHYAAENAPWLVDIELPAAS